MEQILASALGQDVSKLAAQEKRLLLSHPLAVPATDSTQYLLIISGLARLAKDHRLVERLHAAQDTFEIFEVLKQIELRTNPASDLMRKARA